MNTSGDSNAAREDWLHSLIRPDLRPYAERAPLALASMAALLERIGNPQRGLRCIHIAGSKGKGSTALMIEVLLERASLTTGTFMSPHLQRWTERVRIGGAEVTADEFNQALDRLRPEVETLSQTNPDNPPSFFDVLTAAGLWLFARRKVDIAIIEAGIGGRYDATNIIDSVVACITSIELEHADKLGADIASIAHHKAGILKPGVCAVLGRFPNAAADVIRQQVESSACDARWLGEDFDYRSEPAGDGQQIRFRSGKQTINCVLNHPSRHMADNAALALACASALPEFDTAGLANAAPALASVGLPGRAEILQRRPWIVVDAAHTPASIAALVELLNTLPCKERYFLISMSGDKPVDLLAPLMDMATSVTVTSPEPLRSMPADELASRIASRWPAHELIVEPDVSDALAHATQNLTPTALLCVTGSTYVAGAARTFLLSET